MDTILNYLDNMFISFPQTPNVQRVKEDLAEMMEDKYNELISEGKLENEAIGIVISEFGNIQELADELGISKNENKDSIAGADASNKQKHADKDIKGKEWYNGQFEKENKTDDYGNNFRHVTEIEAEEYFFAVKQSSVKIAQGVFLCICSPILILLLSGIKQNLFPISDGVVAGVGVTVLLIMVASAVGLFISAGMKMDTYSYLKKECFTMDEKYASEVFQRQEALKGKFSFKIIVGVIMCILAAVPLIICSIASNNESNQFPIFIGISALLIIVGIAVSLFITAGMEVEAYHVILQQDDFTVKKKSGNKIVEFISSLYWPVMLILYFGVSFLSGAWYITWIIWPLSGVFFGAVSQFIDKIHFQEK